MHGRPRSARTSAADETFARSVASRNSQLASYLDQSKARAPAGRLRGAARAITNLTLEIMMNIFAVVITINKYVTCTASQIDLARLERDLQLRARLRRERAEMDVRARLDELQQRAGHFEDDWSLLLKPRQLKRAIERQHMVGGKFFLIMCAQLALLVYLVCKSIFHLALTGDNLELAMYYERSYYFPRLFSSHETPEIFYKHCLALMLYCLSIRLLALVRLVRNSVANVAYHKRISITQLNLGVLHLFNLNPADWADCVRRCLAHRRQYEADFASLEEHTSIDSRLIANSAALSLKDLIYSVNLIDFHGCFARLSLGRAGAREKFQRCNGHLRAWQNRIDPFMYGLSVLIYVTGALLAFTGVTLVFFCTIYFELDGAARERELRPLTFLETLGYIPAYFEEPWRLLRFFDMLLFTVLQLPVQVDAAVFYADMLILIARAQKVLYCLQHDRKLCTLGAGQYHHQLFNQYGGYFERLLAAASSGGQQRRRRLQLEQANSLAAIVRPAASNYKRATVNEDHFECVHCNQRDDTHLECLMARFKFWRRNSAVQTGDLLSFGEEARLNRRLNNLVRMAQVLSAEFTDLKRSYSIYLNTMIIYSGFCIAYCVSLMLSATTVSTFFSLIVNSVAAAAPLLITISLSIVLDSLFKGIHRNLNLLLVNERRYLTHETIRALMIECYSFETSRDRSIQIASQFSITPESLGPLVAYISTCVLLLRRF